MASHAKLDQPVQFGKYRLDRQLARGGMGEVYLAEWLGELGFAKRLVVKTIRPELASQPRFVELFASEAKTAVMLSHGNIVPVYEFGRVDDTFYIAMGFVDGPSVAALLDAHRARATTIDAVTAVVIVREVLRGLAYAHRGEPNRPPVVHRDVSPRNVLIDRSGQVRIVDFGIALPVNMQVDASMGSSGYVAPEQARAAAADPRADVFSAACLLYELFTLRRAFPKEGVWSAPDMDNVPAPLHGLLLRALAVDPSHRPADAHEFLDALDTIAAAWMAPHPERHLAGHLETTFPQGWEHPTSSPSDLGGAAQSRSGHIETFATRLTIVRPGAPSQRSRNTGILASLAVLVLTAAAWLSWPRQTDVASADAMRQPVLRGATAQNTATHPHAAPAPATQPFIVRELAVTPADARVIVDGETLAGPPFRITLKPGIEHRLEVRRDGYESVVTHVSAATQTPAQVTLQPIPRLKGQLAVFAPSVPWAEVTIDGRTKAHTPLRALTIDEGEHRVLVRCVPDVCNEPRTLHNGVVVVQANKLTRIVAQD